MLVKQAMKDMQAPDNCAFPAGATSPTVNPLLLASASSLDTSGHMNPVLLTSANSLSNSGQLLLGDSPPSTIVPGRESQRRDPCVYDADDPSTVRAETAEEVQQVGKEKRVHGLQGIHRQPWEAVWDLAGEV